MMPIGCVVGRCRCERGLRRHQARRTSANSGQSNQVGLAEMNPAELDWSGTVMRPLLEMVAGASVCRGGGGGGGGCIGGTGEWREVSFQFQIAVQMMDYDLELATFRIRFKPTFQAAASCMQIR